MLREQLSCTDLKLPHQKCNKGSVDAALGDNNTVGEFGALRDRHKVLCRQIKDLDK